MNMTQLKATERSIALTNTQSHGPAVRELCAFLEAQADPRPTVLEAFRVMVRARCNTLYRRVRHGKW